ncbi:unnamed protein product [Caenorhabditis brenneri]
MAASYYDIPLINQWGVMKIVYKKEKKMYIVKSNDDDEVRVDENIKEAKQTQMVQHIKDTKISTRVYATLVKSGYHIITVENTGKNGRSEGERVHLARCQDEFVKKHKTWEVDVGGYKKKIVINLETNEVHVDGMYITVACSLGTTVFNIDGKTSRLENKGDGGWVLAVKDSQVKVFEPRNGPSKT